MYLHHSSHSLYLPSIPNYPSTIHAGINKQPPMQCNADNQLILPSSIYIQEKTPFFMLIHAHPCSCIT